LYSAGDVGDCIWREMQEIVAKSVLREGECQRW
jgi:hypothetical protein